MTNQSRRETRGILDLGEAVDASGGARVGSAIVFPPFRLDPMEQRLWREDVRIHIKPLAFAVLHYLLTHPGKLLTRGQLLARFWGRVHTGDGVLKTQMAQIRHALGDRARAPRFIETVHSHGYRFIGQVQSAADARDGMRDSFWAKAAGIRVPLAPHVVGRKHALDVLRERWLQARSGERQVLFVTGEAGIGKTALVNSFMLEGLAEDPEALILSGQCVDHHGPSEPYLPIIEAFRRERGEAQRNLLLECLQRNATAWLEHLGVSAPVNALLPPQARAASLGPERMLREMAETLEALSAKTGVVLLLEDLHWADSSTLDLLAYIAQRSAPARLLVMATYRPLEAAASRLSDIEQTLQARQQCLMLPVPRLNQDQVREFLDKRFSQHELPGTVPALLCARTSGNPLFISGVVNEWLERGLLALKDGTCRLVGAPGELACCVPDSIVRMVHRALERLSPLERSVLEAASVAGNVFSAAAVAAALSLDLVRVEGLCMRLSQRGPFFRTSGTSEWEDGTVAQRCEFTHALYQHVIYEQIGAARRARLHLCTARRLEAGHEERADGIATELALHFERGRDYVRAFHYLRISGEHALRRGAFDAALNQLTHALGLISRLPDAADKALMELELRCLMAVPLRMTKGFAAPEVEQAYARAAELWDERTPVHQQFLLMAGQGGVHILRAESAAAAELGAKCLILAERHADRAALAEARLVLGVSHHMLGQHRESLLHLNEVIATHATDTQASFVSLGGRHPAVAARCFLAFSSCMMGYPDKALREAEGALQLARELSDPFALAFGFNFCCHVLHLRREHESARKHSDALAAVCAEHGFGMLSAMAVLQEGEAQVWMGDAASGIEVMHRGLAELTGAGGRVYEKYWASVLAEGYARIGQSERALRLIDDAIERQHRGGERVWDAELARTRGEILLRWVGGGEPELRRKRTDSRSALAEASLLHAIEVARQQEARLLELRAAVSLARHWWAQGKIAPARALLTDLYGWFSEASNMPDLREARAVLERLGNCPPDGGRGTRDLKALSKASVRYPQSRR